MQDAAAIIDIARDFAADVVAPQAAAWERERRMPMEAFRAAARLGLCSLTAPVERGGFAVDATTMARVMEELAAADLAFAFCLVVHNNHIKSLCANGSDEQIARYLPDLTAARHWGSFLLTEARGGSDAAAIETRAEKTASGWRIDGEKAWITGAAETSLLALYAQTDPAAGWRGIATFLIERDTPGVVALEPYFTLGAHATGSGGFRFEGCDVPESALLIPPGKGFKAAMAGIDFARVNVAAACCGMLQASLDAAVAWTRERSMFGQTTSDFQGVQWMLADAATDLHAARLMAYDAAALLDEGADARLPAAHAKKFATRMALARIADCAQVVGANGFRHDFPFARHLAGAKMAQYLDGATEIQNVVIARALFA